jgi:hypothetical protein
LMRAAAHSWRCNTSDEFLHDPASCKDNVGGRFQFRRLSYRPLLRALRVALDGARLFRN